MIKQLMSLCALITVLCVHSHAQMKVTIRDLVKIGNAIEAKIEGVSGKVGIESDITQNSSEVDVQGAKTITLGKVTKPGFYVVRLVHARQQVTKIICAFNEEISSAATPINSSPSSDLTVDVLKKFVKNLNADRLTKAAKNGLITFVKSNPVNIAATATACMVIPYFPPAAQACWVGAVTNLADLGTEVMKEAVSLMEKEGIFTKGEATKLRTGFTLANLGIQVALPSARIDNLLSAATTAFEIAVEHEGLKLTMKLTVDEAKKTMMLIELIKK